MKGAGEGNGSAQRWKIQDALGTPGPHTTLLLQQREKDLETQREATLLFKVYSSLSLGLYIFLFWLHIFFQSISQVIWPLLCSALKKFYYRQQRWEGTWSQYSNFSFSLLNRPEDAIQQNRETGEKPSLNLERAKFNWNKFTLLLQSNRK